MKKLGIVVLAWVISLSAFAGNTFDQLYSKYSGDESVTSINLGESLVQIASKFLSDDDKEVKDILKEIKSVKVLVSDSPVNAKLVADARKLVSESHLEELIRVNEENETVKILVAEAGDIITEVMVFVESNDEVVLVNIIGNIDPEKVGKVLKTLNIEIGALD